MFTLFGSMGAVVDRISSIGLVLVMKCLEMPLTQVGRRPAPGESRDEHCQRNAGSQTNGYTAINRTSSTCVWSN